MRSRPSDGALRHRLCGSTQQGGCSEAGGENVVELHERLLGKVLSLFKHPLCCSRSRLCAAPLLFASAKYAR